MSEHEQDVKHSDDLGCTLTRDLCFEAVSPAFTHALGWSSEDLRETRLLDLVHAEDRERTAAELAGLAGWLGAARVDARCRGKDGEYRWLAWTLATDAGTPAGQVRALARDITAAKRAQIEHETFFSESLELLCIADRNGYFTRINPAFTTVLGWSEDELRARPLTDFLHPDDLAPTESVATAILAGAGVVHFENRYRTKQGNYRWLAWTCRYDPGTVKSYAVGRDITAIKEMEAWLERARQEAEQARQEAECANRAKGEFLANMSHELRTPLNAILGYAQILEGDPTLTVRQREGIHTIHQSGNHLLTLINDVLDLARIEAGKLSLATSTFSPGSFFTAMEDMFAAPAKQKRLVFVYQRDADLPMAIRCDETRLRQVVINLLGNAIKFTELGGVTLRVGHADGKLRVSVEDTGPGIPEDARQRIFEPFEQIADQRGEGTGLGLAISRELVHLMDGELHVASELGKGSVFWFEIPAEAVAAWRIETGAAGTLIGYEGEPRTVLVVDDKIENRSIMAHLLMPLGFRVEQASDGAAAVELAVQLRPDIIFMDLVMPALDGFEATRRIREHEALRSTPIIAMSASVLEQSRSRAAGCDGFLPKPLRVDELYRTLAAHLQLAWRYRQPATTQEPGVGQDALASPRSPATSPGAPDMDPRLSAAQLRAIHEAAQIGDIRQILHILEQAGIDDTGAPDGNARRLGEELRVLARSFQSRKIRELVEPLLDPG